MLRVDKLLLVLLLCLILVHALAAHLTRALGVRVLLAQLMSAMCVSAVVGIRARLSLIEVLAHHSFVVFESTASCIVLIHMATVLST